MNREIKFRGKRRKNGEWVIGLPGYTSGGEIGTISGWFGESGFEQYGYVEVLPETVGQFTELRDKNGNEVYEGDLLKSDAQSYIYGNDNTVSDVRYHGGSFYVTIYYDYTPLQLFDFERVYKPNAKMEGAEFASWLSEFTIIGNIHDNPELINQ